MLTTRFRPCLEQWHELLALLEHQLAIRDMKLVALKYTRTTTAGSRHNRQFGKGRDKVICQISGFEFRCPSIPAFNTIMTWALVWWYSLVGRSGDNARWALGNGEGD